MKLGEISLGTRMVFGKYKGNTLEDVLWENAKYVSWCIDQGIFTLDLDAQAAYDARMDDIELDNNMRHKM